MKELGDLVLSDLQKRVLEAAERDGQAAKEYVDDSYERIKALVGSDEPKNVKVNLTMKTEEKLAVYYQILDRLRAKEDPEKIASDIIAFLVTYLSEKQDEAKNPTKAGPVFRRSE